MRFACIINVWLWTQLKFIFLWLPGLSEGLQITGKELGDMCFHLISGGPSESCQEARYLFKQANAWQRKKNSVFGTETAGHGQRGRLGPSERSLGGSELTQRLEEMLGLHTGKQVKAGEERHFWEPPTEHLSAMPRLYLRKFSANPGERGQSEIRPYCTLSVLIWEV